MRSDQISSDQVRSGKIHSNQNERGIFLNELRCGRSVVKSNMRVSCVYTMLAASVGDDHFAYSVYVCRVAEVEV